MPLAARVTQGGAHGSVTRLRVDRRRINAPHLRGLDQSVPYFLRLRLVLYFSGDLSSSARRCSFLALSFDRRPLRR